MIKLNNSTGAVEVKRNGDKSKDPYQSSYIHFKNYPGLITHAEHELLARAVSAGNEDAMALALSYAITHLEDFKAFKVGVYNGTIKPGRLAPEGEDERLAGIVAETEEAE